MPVATRLIPGYTRADLTAALAAGRPSTPPPLREDAALEPLWADLRREAALGADRQPPSYRQLRSYDRDGDRVPYESAYFARRGRLNALAAVACMDGAPVTLGALADMLWSVCDEYTWAVPAHAYLVEDSPLGLDRCVDLFACETAHAVTEIITMLGDRLPAEITDRVRAEVHRRVLDPYFGSPRSWRWEHTANNWGAVCAGAAGMAALALVDDPATLAAMIERCLTVMEDYLSGLGCDGGSPEGIDYWVYGFGYFTYFAEALRARTGLDLLRDTPLAHLAAAFPATVAIGGGKYVSFSDSNGRSAVPTGLITRVRDRLTAPVPGGIATSRFGDDHCHRWAHLARTLAWTDAAVIDAATPDATGWLPGLAWLVDRRTVDGVQITFAAKGGHNDESHNHNDLGHFVLVADGEQLLADLGAGEYRSDYFGPNRYTAYLHPSALGHSLPVIDGREQQPGPDAVAAVVDQHSGPDGSRLTLDLSAAYEGRRMARTLQWSPDATLRLTDRFGDAGTVDELFISGIRPTVGDGHTTWTGAHAAATMRFDPSAWAATVEDLDTVNHRSQPQTVYRLRLRSIGRPVAAFDIAVCPR